MWLPPIAWAALIWFMSSQSKPPTPPIALFAHADKVVHAGIWFVLGGLLARALSQPSTPAPIRAAWGPIAWLLAVSWGVIDEIHQSFVPLRTPDAFDVLADATGALLAVIAWRAWLRRRTSAAEPEPPICA